MGALELGLKVLNLTIVFIATVLGYVARFDRINKSVLERFDPSSKAAFYSEWGPCNRYAWKTYARDNENCPNPPSNSPIMENIFVAFIIISLYILLMDIIISICRSFKILSVGCLGLASVLLLIGGTLILISANQIDSFLYPSILLNDLRRHGLAEVVDEQLAHARKNIRYDLKIASGVMCLVACALNWIVLLLVILTRERSRQYQPSKSLSKLDGPQPEPQPLKNTSHSFFE